jgi:hypothetical protein
MSGSTASVFSSLGATFHGFPSPNSFLQVRSSSAVHPCKTSTHPDHFLSAFENRLATDLQRLILPQQCDQECSHLSARSLQQAVDVMCLSAYSRAEDILPHFRRALNLDIEECSKWVNQHLDDTISLLDVCDLVKNRITSISRCQQFLQLAIHCLGRTENTTEVQLLKARTTLANCLKVMKAEEVSKLKKCKSSLNQMGQRVASPWGANSSTVGEFVGIMNTCRATAVFVCGAVVASLSFEPTKSLFLLPKNGMKEEMEKRGAKHASAILLEVAMADEAARSLYDLLDKFLKKSSPLSKDDAFELKRKISRLKTSADDLKDGMDALDKQMNELFTGIIACRMKLLDMVSYSQP